MTDDVARVEKMLIAHAQAGEREALRRFALECARGAIADAAMPPLWCSALEMVEARLAGSLSEGTFRHRAAALECRFPLLAILAGLRQCDHRAATALAVMAALRQSALEAALDAARAERMRAGLAASAAHLTTAASAAVPGPADARFDAARAVMHCARRQLARLSGAA